MTPYSAPGIIVKDTLEALCHNVSSYFNISVDDMKSKKRHREIVDARHVFFYMAYYLKMGSLFKIGAVLNKDHSTVLHSLHKKDSCYEFETILKLYLNSNKHLLINNKNK